MYSTYVLSQMNAQQFDEVYTFKSFKVIAAVKPVTMSALGQRTISLNTPLTVSEIFAGAMSDVFSLETVAGVSDVKVSILLARQATLNAKLALALHSNSITVTLPDLSVCAATGCAFSMVLQSVVNVTYNNGSTSAPSFETTCGAKPSIMTYPCPDNLNVTAVCDGLSPGQKIVSRCPYLVTQPNCGRLSSMSSSVSEDICRMASFTSTQTTCQCQVPMVIFSGGSRRRLDSVSRQLDSVTRQLLSSGKLQMGTVTSRQVVTNALASNPPSLSPTPTPTPDPTIFTANNTKVGGLSSTNVIILSVVLVVLGCAVMAGIFIYFCIVRKKKKLPFSVRNMNKERSINQNDRSLMGDDVYDRQNAEIFMQDQYDRSLMGDSPQDVIAIVGDTEER
jgi:hypothetical protein